MNLQQSKFLYLGIIALSLLIIGYTLYYFYGTMGGFKEVKVIRSGSVERTIAGIHYVGTARSNEYEAIRKTCEEQITKNKLNGFFTEITFQNDTLSPNEIDQFIGITLNTDMAEIPYEFEVRDFKCDERYVLFLAMHPALRKPAYKYEELITEAASKDDKQLDNFFMAIHYDMDSLAVEGWVK